MGINIDQLSPAAQRQALQKLAELERQKALRNMKQPEAPKQRKYHNQPTERQLESGKVIKFDSQKEANRLDELVLELKAGTIRDLKLQADFTLCEAYTTPDGERHRPMKYVADFVYERLVTRHYVIDGGGSTEAVQEWELVCEDVKGGNATKTKTYQIKKRLMLERFGIAITEV